MYMTHQFAHRETLERACNWLSKLGFDSSRMEIHDEGAPRLAFWGAVGEGMAVQSILNAIESSDPDGHPSVWDLAQRPFTPAAPRASGDRDGGDRQRPAVADRLASARRLVPD